MSRSTCLFLIQIEYLIINVTKTEHAGIHQSSFFGKIYSLQMLVSVPFHYIWLTAMFSKAVSNDLWINVLATHLPWTYWQPIQLANAHQEGWSCYTPRRRHQRRRKLASWTISAWSPEWHAQSETNQSHHLSFQMFVSTEGWQPDAAFPDGKREPNTPKDAPREEVVFWMPTENPTCQGALLQHYPKMRGCRPRAL